MSQLRVSNWNIPALCFFFFIFFFFFPPNHSFTVHKQLMGRYWRRKRASGVWREIRAASNWSLNNANAISVFNAVRRLIGSHLKNCTELHERRYLSHETNIDLSRLEILSFFFSKKNFIEKFQIILKKYGDDLYCYFFMNFYIFI